MENLFTEEKMLDKNFYAPYNRCLNLVETIIKDYIKVNEGYDVVSYINRRIKSEESIKGKLDRHNLDYNIDNIKNKLYDIAGIRVVCPFLKDVEDVINYLKTNPYIESVVVEKDYINKPKTSGYRSYHMIVTVKDTVLDDEEVRILPVEIQVRTLAMDCYAALEHRLRYKKDNIMSDNMNEKIERALNTTINIDNSLNVLLNNFNKGIEEVDDLSKTKYDLYKYEYAKAKLKSIVRRIQKELNSGNYKPVEAAKVRLKTNESINRKLKSRNKDSIDDIHDVVAARLICPFLGDISTIIDKIIFNSEFEVIGYKDYVNYPKENGYSSFHILVKIPVYIDGVSDYVKAEIQVRTIAMNMWASLHHKLCYEQNDTSSEVAEMLKVWAKDLREIDRDYDNIYRSYCRDENVGKAYKNNKNKKRELIKK